ncbi:hypothetical protein SKAU_G00247800 [Synaphobranchus kaupii]|uniref:Uncharacterized protein n=1 Tax=Synaphobranchus kaupii TaxID=118154 RepID=A0A9Q1F289_SYNKA|nr:hypothetical protein SKAU_G00247800 [Synaphobranchus kaupii]
MELIAFSPYRSDLWAKPGLRQRGQICGPGRAQGRGVARWSDGFQEVTLHHARSTSWHSGGSALAKEPLPSPSLVLTLIIREASQAAPFSTCESQRDWLRSRFCPVVSDQWWRAGSVRVLSPSPDNPSPTGWNPERSGSRSALTLSRASTGGLISHLLHPELNSSPPGRGHSGK